MGAGVLLTTASGRAMTGDASAPTDFAARAKKEFEVARARFQTGTNVDQAAWQFARACFDFAEFATNNDARAELAQQGIAATRALIARAPGSCPGHYYLAMNLGQLARTKWLGALRIVDEMEVEFAAARRLDEHFDYAGPDRNLGLLYSQAPSIGSIGSRSKARQHLQRAVELAPDYPENRLNLIEAFLKWGDTNGVRRELKALEASWVKAHEKFTGEAWEQNWLDWDKRLEAIKRRVGAAAKVIQAPRHGD